MKKNKLVVEQSIVENAELYRYKFKVNDRDLVISISSDTEEIKEVFYQGRLDKVTDRLKDYLPKKVVETLLKYKCNFYIAKGGYYIDMRYHLNVCTPSNNFYRVVINGKEEDIYINEDIDTNYSVMKYMWRNTTKEEE